MIEYELLIVRPFAMDDRGDEEETFKSAGECAERMEDLTSLEAEAVEELLEEGAEVSEEDIETGRQVTARVKGSS